MRLKTDIRLIDNATAVLKRIKTYSYYFISDPVETRQREYGVLAQELETFLPELVSTVPMEDSTETKAVNYIGFIPFLINGFNEQQELIERQQQAIEMLQNVVASQEMELMEWKEMLFACCGKPKNSQGYTLPEDSQEGQEQAILYQNAPNPFSSNTEIACYIPEITGQAFLYIYNLQGIEQRAYPILQAGANTITVQASDLLAGMYLYTLVVDNKIIDTKRMILTK